MAGDLLFKRRVRLTIANKIAEDYKSITADVVQIEELRVAFKVKKSLTKEPNTAEVTVTNLSPQRRASLQTKGVKFILEAGYEGAGIAQLFVGDVRTIDHVRDAANWNTVIKSGDGERAFRYARVSESFAAGSPLSDVVQNLAGKLGLGLGNVTTKAAALSQRFDQGFAASGPVSRELDRVLAAAGLTWSVQDGDLQILAPDEPGALLVPELSPETGLIGSPEFGAPLKKGGRPLVKFRCLLDGKIKPGGRVELRSERHRGPIRVVKLEHTGDTAGGDWYTDCEGTPV